MTDRVVDNRLVALRRNVVGDPIVGRAVRAPTVFIERCPTSGTPNG